jgi:hypothetical protein
MGKLTNCSTSSAAYPPASVMITTCGAYSSGKTSAGILGIIIPATSINTPAKTKTTAELLSEKAISLLNMFS